MGTLGHDFGVSSAGMLADEASTGFQRVGSFGLFVDVYSGLNDGSGSNSERDDLASSHIGSFLVKSGAIPVAATPIPGALPLFASALAGIGFVGRRRRATA